MGVADIGKEQYPFLARDVELLKRAIHIDRATLGICLGAQLLAFAAGAKVHPNSKPGAKPDDPPVPAPELGWLPVTYPFPGGTEPIVMGTHDGMMVFSLAFRYLRGCRGCRPRPTPRRLPPSSAQRKCPAQFEPGV